MGLDEDPVAGEDPSQETTLEKNRITEITQSRITSLTILIIFITQYTRYQKYKESEKM